jgi:hypothetical protein
MEAVHPTAGWEKVGDRFYRKTQLYTAVFDQDLDLDNYIVAGAPYGGAIGEFIFKARFLAVSFICDHLKLFHLLELSTIYSWGAVPKSVVFNRCQRPIRDISMQLP